MHRCNPYCWVVTQTLLSLRHNFSLRIYFLMVGWGEVCLWVPIDNLLVCHCWYLSFLSHYGGERAWNLFHFIVFAPQLAWVRRGEGREAARVEVERVAFCWKIFLGFLWTANFAEVSWSHNKTKFFSSFNRVLFPIASWWSKLHVMWIESLTWEKFHFFPWTVSILDTKPGF